LAWARKHPEKCRASRASWAKRHPDLIRAYCRQRRVWRAGVATGPISAANLEAKFRGFAEEAIRADEAELLRLKPAEEAPTPKADDTPKREQFESYEEFIEARADYRARKAVQEERQKQQSETQKSTEAERQKGAEVEFRKRLQATASEISDFADVMENAGDIYITNGMRDAIQESPLGPRILYEIAKNPQEAERLAGLSPSAAAREIGKIEARLEAATKKPDTEAKDTPTDERNPDGTFKPKKEPSKAPPPPEPIGARSVAGNDLPSDKDDAETWRRKELRRLERLKGR